MPHRIAIVEDDESIRRMLVDALSEQGYDVVAYADGHGGLAGLRAAPPSLVLLDLRLPGLSGIEVCRALRADPTTAHVLVVMITGLNAEADQILGFEVGADDYVVKPFDPDELRARVQVGVRVLTLQVQLGERVTEVQKLLTKASLAFEILIPSSNAIGVNLATLIQEQLRAIGAQVSVHTIDRTAMGPQMQKHDFDAYMGGWTMNPGRQGMRQTWTSGATEELNFGAYQNPRFDALLDSALTLTPNVITMTSRAATVTSAMALPASVRLSLCNMNHEPIRASKAMTKKVPKTTARRACHLPRKY
jgi:CheY-like chemotaxis protein